MPVLELLPSVLRSARSVPRLMGQEGLRLGLLELKLPGWELAVGRLCKLSPGWGRLELLGSSWWRLLVLLEWLRLER